MAPIVGGLAAEYQGEVGVRDINTSTDETAAKFDIQVVPTYVFLDSSGKVVDRQEGGNPDALRAGFEKVSGK